MDELSQKFELTLPENFVESYRARVAELFATDLMPIEHVEETLKNLEHPKAVVSSGPLEKIKHALNVCGLSKYFGDNIYSSYEMNIWKPDPRVYLLAAQDMGFQPENCVVIEDSLIGVEAGYNSGMRTLFFNQFNETCEYSSVTNFNSMKELAKLIQNN